MFSTFPSTSESETEFFFFLVNRCSFTDGLLKAETYFPLNSWMGPGSVQSWSQAASQCCREIKVFGDLLAP